MDVYEATFVIESKTDAYAVERLLDRVYDSLREEARTVREGTADSTEMLSEFEALLEAAQRRKPGRLRLVFEQADEAFEG